jgi:hypothetical protein
MSTLIEEGYTIRRKFFSDEELSRINSEIDFAFSKNSINGSLGGVFTCLRNYPRRLLLPSLQIRKANLFEISLDIMEQVGLCVGEFNLTAIQVFDDVDIIPLFWHTDHRIGTYRAFLYLEGGSENSGALRYAAGSHRTTHSVKHNISESDVIRAWPDLKNLNGEPGDLAVIDINGFHANCPRIAKRRVIVFEFQPRGSTYPKATVVMPDYYMSDRVVKNIDFFRLGRREMPNEHGDDSDFDKAPNLPPMVAAKLLAGAIKDFFTMANIKKVLARALRNFKFRLTES